MRWEIQFAVLGLALGSYFIPMKDYTGRVNSLETQNWVCILATPKSK